MRTAAVFLVAAFLIGTAPAHAQNGTPPPSAAPAPVTISACKGGIASIELMEIATYDVTFRNTAAVPADEVRISARYGRHEKRATFDVKGLFAPGVDVNKHLRRTVSGGLYSYMSDTNDCFVDYVHFTNGSSWGRAPH